MAGVSGCKTSDDMYGRILWGDSCHPLELLPSTNGSIQGGDGDIKIGADMIVSRSESRMRLFAVGAPLG